MTPTIHGFLVSFGVMLAATVSGATGLAFPLIATPIFMFDYTPPKAVLITSICSLIGQFFSIVLLRGSVSYEIRWRFIVGGLAGVPFGTMALLWSDEKPLRISLGALLIALGLLRLIGPHRLHVAHQRIPESVIGFFGGFCGGVLGIASAVPAIWLTMRGIDKIRQRAIVQPYIIVAQCTSLLLLCWHGIFDMATGRAAAMYVPPVLGGILAGTVAFHCFSCEWYGKAVAILIVASGVALFLH